MGKKKDERKRREREAEQAASAGACGAGERHDHADSKHGEPRHADAKHAHTKHTHAKHDGAAPLAGIAAAVARQMGTPIGRQMIAAGLMAAAGAIARHDAKPAGTRPTPPPAPPAPPAPPEPSVSPKSDGVEGSTGPFAGETPEPPRSDAATLPPEMAKVLDSVTVGLERLFAGFGKPKTPGG